MKYIHKKSIKTTIIVTALIIVLSTTVVSCFSTNQASSQTNYDKGPYVINRSTSIEKVKRAITKSGGMITSEAPSSVSFDLKETKWTWEPNNGKPANPDADVVVKKLKQLGTNMTSMPQSVASSWQISFNDNKITITLVKLVENYTLSNSIVDTDGGYSLKNLEKRIEPEL